MMLFAQNIGVDFGHVVPAIASALALIVGSICTFLSLYIRTRAASLEEKLTAACARITAVEKQAAKCEAERDSDRIGFKAEIASRDELLETDLPSDDFSMNQVFERVRSAMAAKGITISIAIVAKLVRKVKADKAAKKQMGNYSGGEVFG